MEFELTWVDPSLVICRTSGVASLEGYVAMMQAIASDPSFRPDVKLLTDQTNLDTSALIGSDIEQIVDLRTRYLGDQRGRSAVVVDPGSAGSYGLGRMFEALVGSGTDAAVKVFKTLEEARAWLQSADDDSASPA
jgi:hypothetical protein